MSTKIQTWRAAIYAGMTGVALAMVSSTGCSSGTSNNPDATAPCTSSTLCSGVCVDTQTDNANCGVCGTACTNGEVCSQGKCATTCGGGTALCGSTCVDTKNDPQHCGGCNTTCTTGEVCTNGACGTTCGSAQTFCGGDGGPAYCASTQTDNSNCGACGVTCAAGESCQSGACKDACVASDGGVETLCTPDAGAPYCANLATDNANCGTCGVSCTTGSCTSGKCVSATYYTLTGTVDPTTVFNTIDQTYEFPNNLANSIWHRTSNVVVTGDYATSAYWDFGSTTTGYSATANVGTGYHERMVQVPATQQVIYENIANSNTTAGAASSVHVATIDNVTGALSADAVATFSDAFTGNCQLNSSSATEFLCFDGTSIRFYTTTAGSSTLTYEKSLSLGTALPTAAACATNTVCFGGTFAWDGAYYYFTSSGFSNTNLSYIVYNPDGTLNQTVTATGSAAINSVYFDWSVGRYSTHDGFGTRTGGTIHASTASNSDSQCYSPISANHTALP